MNSAIKLHGGKHYLAGKVVGLMAPHIHYVEPYAGSLAVLFVKDPEGVSEVVNDIDDNLMNFWKVLSQKSFFELFQRQIEATPFSQKLWQDTFDYYNENGHLGQNPVSRAVSFFILCRQSLAGRMKSFATISRNRTRRGMNEQASAWLSSIEGLQEVHERLRRVVVLCDDAVRVIKSQDSKNTFFYNDPPYMHETRTSKQVYKYEMNEAQHIELLHTLSCLKGKFLLSGYHCKLYDDFAKQSGWNLTEFALPNNSAGGFEKRIMTECLWRNY